MVFGQSEVEPSGDAVLETAAARNQSAYDAQFVVAAIPNRHHFDRV